MPPVMITRAAAKTVLRSDLKAGQIFAVKGRGDKLGSNFANIGHNGRYYSVNLKNGELASSRKGSSPVTITGKWRFEVNRKPSPSVVRECRRSDVCSGEVFHIHGKDTLYAHMGTITRAMQGFLSVPLARSENHAITRNGNSRVSVVGTFVIKGEASA